ncbi:MAG: MarR family transcriptional regulator [Chloroflexota bacterium]
MTETSYADQINEVVFGFMQVWIKFEAMLPSELARTENLLHGTRARGEPHTSRSYELFYRVSSVLAQKESHTMREFSHALSVPLSTATRIADWLVARGYIERLPDPEDRRIVRLALTEDGKLLHKTIGDYVRERVEQILSCLTVEERATLFQLIGKVASSLREIAD